MEIHVFCRTDKGSKRESNQDSFLVSQDLGLYIVADGMGGHSGGEVASSMAVSTLDEYVRAQKDRFPSTRDLLVGAFSEASHKIYDRAHQEKKLLGMGTTMVCVYLTGNSAFIGNVGDSRAYLYRRSHLWQLTEDHSLVNEQLRAGMITEQQAENFLGKNVITRSVGYEREVSVDVLERPLQKGDTLLLCSDGLSGMVEDDQIEEILTRFTGESAVEECVKTALENGGSDNVTVLLVEVT
ncbi:MAG: Stp1/IreP family PP2C-type Ser/Thr phosphatase [Pseudobdellovibrionaceae bacterium]|jgi:serine/threonine protein phosphatase PrpC